MREDANRRRPAGIEGLPTRRSVLVGALLTAGLAAVPVSAARAADRRQVLATPLATADGSVVLERIHSANRHGLILGTGSTAGGDESPLVWTPAGPVVPQVPPLTSPYTPHGTVGYIGDRGQLAGGYTSSVDNTQRALVWDRYDAAPREVDFGRGNATASVINGKGQVGGTGWDNYTTDGALNTSYFYDGLQAVHIESPPDTTARTRVAGLNDHGTVLATWGPTEGNPSAGAFLWRDGAVVADLCALAGDHSLMFSALNARDQVVLGHRGLGGDPLQRTYLYDAGAVTTLTGPAGGDVSITGTLTDRVNRPLSDRGHVVGSYRADTGTRAFLWHRGRSLDLGTLGGTNAIATAVNNRGEAAGTSDTADGTTRAFLWRRGGLLALDPPGTGYVSTSAVWITDQGDVLGYAETAAGDRQAVQWTVR